MANILTPLAVSANSVCDLTERNSSVDKRDKTSLAARLLAEAISSHINLLWIRGGSLVKKSFGELLMLEADEVVLLKSVYTLS